MPNETRPDEQEQPQQESDVDEYGICRRCGFRAGIACICGMTFQEKIQTVELDYHGLRRLHASTE